MRVDLQSAYVLHTRPYRDTSLLVDILTREHGRIALVAKGVRTGKSQRRALLNPFTGLLVSFHGRGGLKLLTALEGHGTNFALQGAALYCGFYMNELLLRLLAEQDPHPYVYEHYQSTLTALSRDTQQEPWLRRFELNILDELGYGVNLQADATLDTPLQPDELYQFEGEHGFTQVPLAAAPTGDRSQFPLSQSSSCLFKGRDLLAIAADDFSDRHTRRAAKRLTRLALQPLLGNKPLKSRELFGRAH